MYPSDNYGSKWVKGMINWLKDKTINGIKYSSLIVAATLECGLRRQKLIEIVNEYLETGLIEIREGIVYWVDVSIKPTNPNIATKEIKEKPKKGGKKKDKENEENKTEVELAYELHIQYCESNNQTPDTFEEYIKRFEREKDKDKKDLKVDVNNLGELKE